MSFICKTKMKLFWDKIDTMNIFISISLFSLRKEVKTMHFSKKNNTLIFFIAALLVIIAIVFYIIPESHSIAFSIIYPQ
jgi:hypothetical protein